VLCRRAAGRTFLDSGQFVAALTDIRVGFFMAEAFGLLKMAERRLQVTHLIVRSSGRDVVGRLRRVECNGPLGVDGGSGVQFLVIQCDTAIVVCARSLIVECDGADAVSDGLGPVIEMDVRGTARMEVRGLQWVGLNQTVQHFQSVFRTSVEVEANSAAIEHERSLARGPQRNCRAIEGGRFGVSPRAKRRIGLFQFGLCFGSFVSGICEELHHNGGTGSETNGIGQATYQARMLEKDQYNAAESLHSNGVRSVFISNKAGIWNRIRTANDADSRQSRCNAHTCTRMGAANSHFTRSAEGQPPH
jgi:hypothetical protein